MKLIFTALAAICLLAASAQADETCGLKRHASLSMTMLPDGGLAVPATINGQDVMLSVAFGGASFLYKSFVDGASLKKLSAPRDVTITVAGEQVMARASVAEFKIGLIAAHDVPFLVVAQQTPPSPDVAGELGIDILSAFDVEYNFSTMTMNLFSQDHCPGTAVYWADSYASVPLDLSDLGHPSVQMQLDGKSVSVDFYAAAGHGRMALATAKRIFGIDEHSAGISAVPGDDGKPGYYRYPFKTLSIDGLTIANPQIALNPGAKDCMSGRRFEIAQSLPGFKNRLGDNHDDLDKVQECFGSEVDLALDELRKLHLYFAYGEKTLYLTAASATKTH